MFNTVNTTLALDTVDFHLTSQLLRLIIKYFHSSTIAETLDCLLTGIIDLVNLKGQDQGW